MHIDSYYLILVIPTLILSLWAQIMVKSTFAKYSKILCSRKFTGAATAAQILQLNKVNDVRIESVSGSLTDHYDPSKKAIRLSSPVCNNSSIAAVGVAAHEAGHALQHAQHWGPVILKKSLVPVAKIGSSMGPWLALAGLALSLPLLVNIGIILFGGAVLFYVITLPVEFNASSRALTLLRDNNILSPDELKGARKVLNAAAMTYVASTLTALMSFLRLFLRSRGRR